MADCWVKMPERGTTASAMAVTLKSLANQVQLFEQTRVTGFHIDKDSRTVTVTVAVNDMHVPPYDPQALGRDQSGTANEVHRDISDHFPSTARNV